MIRRPARRRRSPPPPAKSPYPKDDPMALSVLYIGGTGQISLPCVEASVRTGHKVTVLNRGRTAAALPTGVETLVADMNDAAYGELADRRFDVVAQFRVYAADQMKRDIAAFTGK